MKKIFLIALAVGSTFAACEKDEINDLQNQVNVNKSQQVAGDNTVAAEAAAALAVEAAKLQTAIDLAKIAQEEGDEALKAALDAAVEALNASIEVASQEAQDNLDAAIESLTKLINEEATKLQDNLDAAAEALEAADEDLQSSIAEAQANLDAAVKELEAADESNLSAALDAVQEARVAAQAAIDAVELEGGNDGLSEEQINALIKAAVDAIPAADLTDLTDRLDVLEAVEVPAGFDDADLKESIVLLQGQIDALVIQSVEDINKLIDAAIALIAEDDDSGLQDQIDVINGKIADLPDAFNDSDIQEKLADLQIQINELSGIDYYSKTPWTPDFSSIHTENFSQSRTVSLVIVGAVDPNPPAALVTTQTVIVSSSTVTSTVDSSEVSSDDRDPADTDGTGTYVKTVITYSAEGYNNTHFTTSYGGYVAAAVIPVEPTDLPDIWGTPSAWDPAYSNNTENFTQTRTVSQVQQGIALDDEAPLNKPATSRDVVTTSSTSTSTVNSADIDASDRVAEDTLGTGTYVKTVITYTSVSGSDTVGTFSDTSYGGYIAAPAASWLEGDNNRWANADYPNHYYTIEFDGVANAYIVQVYTAADDAKIDANGGDFGSNIQNVTSDGAHSAARTFIAGL